MSAPLLPGPVARLAALVAQGCDETDPAPVLLQMVGRVVGEGTQDQQNLVAKRFREETESLLRQTSVVANDVFRRLAVVACEVMGWPEPVGRWAG